MYFGSTTAKVYYINILKFFKNLIDLIFRSCILYCVAQSTSILDTLYFHRAVAWSCTRKKSKCLQLCCVSAYRAPTHPLTHHCKRKVKTFKTHSFKSKSFNHFMTDKNGKFCKWFSIHSCIFSAEKGEQMWVGPMLNYKRLVFLLSKILYKQCEEEIQLFIKEKKNRSDPSF